MQWPESVSSQQPYFSGLIFNCASACESGQPDVCVSPASGTGHEQVAGDTSTPSDEYVGLEHLNPTVEVHQEWTGRCAGLRSLKIHVCLDLLC